MSTIRYTDNTGAERAILSGPRDPRDPPTLDEIVEAAENGEPLAAETRAQYALRVCEMLVGAFEHNHQEEGSAWDEDLMRKEVEDAAALAACVLGAPELEPMGSSMSPVRTDPEGTEALLLGVLDDLAAMASLETMADEAANVLANPNGSPCHADEALFLVRRTLTERMGGAEHLAHGSRGEDLEQALRTLVSAVHVCNVLVHAYQRGAERGSMDWSDVDGAAALASVITGEALDVDMDELDEGELDEGEGEGA